MAGRPRRSVPRVQSNIRIDAPVKRELEAQAQDAGMPLSTYLEHVVAHAFRYSGPYLTPMDTLPTSIPLTSLRRAVASLDRHSCPSVRVGQSPYVTVKLDEPLADPLRQRARGFGVPYTDYLRGVLHLAAGFTASGSSGQLDLGFDVSTAKGERQLRAS